MVVYGVSLLCREVQQPGAQLFARWLLSQVPGGAEATRQVGVEVQDHHFAWKIEWHRYFIMNSMECQFTGK